MDIIYTTMEIIESQEKVKGVWDSNGKYMNIAVKTNNTIAIYTPYWPQVHYIPSSSDTQGIWKSLGQLSDKIGRKLVKSNKGRYVYIDHLNTFQIQDIVAMLLKIINTQSCDIVKVWELQWDISDATLPTGD